MGAVWFGHGCRNSILQVARNRRTPDFGLHGVCRVTLCGVTGMMQGVWDLTGAAKAPLARKVQAVLDVARLLSKCVSRASRNAQEANTKGLCGSRLQPPCTLCSRAFGVHWLLFWRTNQGCESTPSMVMGACFGVMPPGPGGAVFPPHDPWYGKSAFWMARNYKSCGRVAPPWRACTKPWGFPWGVPRKVVSRNPPF